jgi:hypothetical protein
VAFFAVTASLVACAAILDIQDRPLRRADAGPTSDGALVEAGDAGGEASCTTDESLGCARQCARHDFCDDFDEPGQTLTTKWTFTGVTNPLLKGDASTIELVLDAGRSGSSSVLTKASTANTKSAYGIILKDLSFYDLHPGANFSGVRAAADIQVESIAVFDGGGGDDAGLNVMPVLGMLTNPPVPTPAAVAIVVSPVGVLLQASLDVLDNKYPHTSKWIFQGEIARFSTNWVRIELVVAPPSVAAAAGFLDCAKEDAGLVVAGSVAATYRACMGLTDVLASPTWPRTPILAAGTIVFETGMARVRTDNVILDFWQ